MFASRSRSGLATIAGASLSGARLTLARFVLPAAVVVLWVLGAGA